MKASKLLTDAAAAKTDEERKVLAIQQHVLFKEVDKMVAEIEGIGLDNDQISHISFLIYHWYKLHIVPESFLVYLGRPDQLYLLY